MDALECLKTRRSVRAYDPRPLPRELVEDVVDCARLAPTAMNHQPWSFVAVTDASARARLAEKVGHSGFLAQAPVCLAVVCQHMDWSLEDGCAAVTTALAAAWAHGLGSCWVAVHGLGYAAAVAELLGVPEGHEVVALVSLGYPAETPAVEKKALAEVLRWESF